MTEIEAWIKEVREWRLFHRAQYQNGVRGACIEASACAIREKALLDCKAAILREQKAKWLETGNLPPF